MRVLRAPLTLGNGTDFFSSFGARMGPQPSWTNPFAIVRYVHYPNGLISTSSSRARPLKIVDPEGRDGIFALLERTGAAASTFHDRLTRSSALLTRLGELRDGDAIEVEQWGGMLGPDECPPICGLWANVWRGTGVMLRVRRPFVSLSKTTAIVEMIQLLAERNASAFATLVEVLGTHGPMQAVRERHPAAPVWACLSSLMLAHVPCGDSPRKGVMASLAQRWGNDAHSLTPQAIMHAILALGHSRTSLSLSDAGRFALYWMLGICGKGQKTNPFWASSPVGPDGLLTGLACVLGYKTVVLTASANDNGLLHSELVDYELPDPLGWKEVNSTAVNDVQQCLMRPFDFVKADRRKGAASIALRRQEMYDYWRATAKFVLPTDPMGPTSQPVAPCQLAFGRHGGAGPVGACVGPKVRTQPTAHKACWAWCNGTASQTVLSSASLGHVRRFSTATMPLETDWLAQPSSPVAL